MDWVISAVIYGARIRCASAWEGICVHVSDSKKSSIYRDDIDGFFSFAAAWKYPGGQHAFFPGSGCFLYRDRYTGAGLADGGCFFGSFYFVGSVNSTQ